MNPAIVIFIIFAVIVATLAGSVAGEFAGWWRLSRGLERVRMLTALVTFAVYWEWE